MADQSPRKKPPEDDEPSEGAQAASPQTKTKLKKPRIPEPRHVPPSLAAARTALNLDEKDEQGLTNRQRLLAGPSAADKYEAQQAAEAAETAEAEAAEAAATTESASEIPTGTFVGIGGDPWLYSLDEGNVITVFNTDEPNNGWKNLKPDSPSYSTIMDLLGEGSGRLVFKSDTLQDMTVAEVPSEAAPAAPVDVPAAALPALPAVDVPAAPPADSSGVRERIASRAQEAFNAEEARRAAETAAESAALLKESTPGTFGDLADTGGTPDFQANVENYLASTQVPPPRLQEEEESLREQTQRVASEKWNEWVNWMKTQPKKSFDSIAQPGSRSDRD